jgi:hypothetical protein
LCGAFNVSIVLIYIYLRNLVESTTQPDFLNIYKQNNKNVDIKFIVYDAFLELLGIIKAKLFESKGELLSYIKKEKGININPRASMDIPWREEI